MASDPAEKIVETLPRILYSVPPIFRLIKGPPNELDIALLRILDKNGPLNVTDIHKILNLHKVRYGLVSARLNVLQKKGFVKEEVIGRDREKEITISGKETLENIEAERKKYIEPILDLLTLSQRETLASFFEKIPALLVRIQKEI